MKCNQWTLGLAALGLVSLTSIARADSTNMIMTAVSSTTLSGYVDTSIQWNLGTGDAHAPTYGFEGPAKADGFNLNVVDLNLEKDPDAADGWGAGYKVELWLGPDANTLGTSSAGFSADLAVKNAYVDLKAPLGNGLDIKLGVFDTPIGYEVADSPNNPNFTRSYGFNFEPTTHTGVLLSYTINDMFSVSAGMADTFGARINGKAQFVPVGPNSTLAESYKTYMASLAFTAPTNMGWFSGSSASAAIINGYNAGAPGGFVGGADQTSYYFGTTINTPLTALKVGAAFDFVDVGTQPLTTVGGARRKAYAEVYALYATYQLTEKLSINGRTEYMQQSKSGVTGGGILPSKALEATVTVQYDLWKNVLSRLEARWDHQAGSPAGGNAPSFGGNNTTIAGFGTVNNSYELLANIVYKF